MTLFRKKHLFSTILNILGLSVAVATFIILSIQVMYDWGYDRNYPDSDRICRLEHGLMSMEQGRFTANISRPMIEELKGVSPEIEAAAHYQYSKSNYSNVVRPDNEDMSYSISVSNADTGIVKVFPFEFIQGDISGFVQPWSAIISETAAKRIFPDKSAIGEILRFRGSTSEEVRIVAVYKDFPENSSVNNGIIANMGDMSLYDTSEWSTQFYMKLRTPESAEAVKNSIVDYIVDSEIGDLFNDSGQQREELEATVRPLVRISSLHDSYYALDIEGDGMGKGKRSTTLILFTISVLIVIIAIINFINFSMATVPFRIKSINTRKVLGRGRAPLIMSQIAETVFLAFIAYLLSLLLFYVFSGTSLSSYISGSLRFQDNMPVLAVSFLLIMLTAVTAGFFPALYSTSFPPAMVLKGSFSMSVSGRRLRSVLVGFQFVISLVLITANFFIHRQTEYMKNYDMGFNRSNILTFYCGYRIGSKADLFEDELKKNPRIMDVTFAGNALVGNTHMGWGRSLDDGTVTYIDCIPVSINFLDFFNMEIESGRNFQESDNMKPNGTVIMNSSALAAYPSLHIGSKYPGHASGPADIVGVVKNFNFRPMHYGITPVALYVFGSEPWWPLPWCYVKVIPEDVQGTVGYIRKVIEDVDPQSHAEETEITFLDESIDNLYGKESRLDFLINVASVLSLFISVIGVLGLVYFETQFRRREIAVRKVFGADSGTILAMINRHYSIITVASFIVSVPLSWAVINIWRKGFAYQASLPVWIFLLAFLIILSITLLTVSLLSYRAASSNPVDSISNE